MTRILWRISNPGSHRPAAAARRLLLACLVTVVPLLAAQPVAAGACGDTLLGVYHWSATGQFNRTNNCFGGSGFRCYRAESTGTSVELANPSCDPQVSSCALHIHALLEIPGLRQMVIEDGLSASPTPTIRWYPCAGAACTQDMICGLDAAGGKINFDAVDTWLETSASCAEALALELSLQVVVCQAASGCTKTSVHEVPGATIAAAMGCLPVAPPTSNCGAGDGACATCVAVGGGGASPAGGAGGATPPESGPGARLRYSAGGAGQPGTPGHAVWRQVLGLGWSHDYAQRIVEDPAAGDETEVWLINQYGTFRRFTDLEAGSGLRAYQTAAPSDEERTLFFDSASGGWELHELDDTVHRFDSAGRWLSTTDRNGNAKTATYDGSGRLTEVAMPDGRKEAFTYHASGKLAAIREVGVGADCLAQPQSCRTWSYLWSGDVLRQIDRPDGSAWSFRYEDGRFPGFMTQMLLVGAGGTTSRLDTAWKYDSSGRVETIWRGASTTEATTGLPIPSTASVDVWSFAVTASDAQGRPTVVDVTDPLGVVSQQTFGRDTASDKPKLLSTSGGCPVCGSGPNSQFEYGDAANPLQPTREIDGRGVWTNFAYDAHGQVTMRIDGANDPFSDPTLPRTTLFTYDPDFPAFSTTIEGPFTGGSGSRVTTHVYDPATGNLESTTLAGNEATLPGGTFSLETVTTYNAAGQPLLVDPPGYGTTDATSYTYDVPGRNGLLADTHTDPLAGTTTFGYDAFNRTVRVVDPNGVATDTEYDALNRVRRILQRGPDDLVETDDLVTSHFYNSLGDLTCTKLPRGNGIAYLYDAAGRLTEIRRGLAVASPTGTSCLTISSTNPAQRILYTLDKAGHRTNEKLSRSSGSGWQSTPDAETTYTYSSLCHLDSVTQAPGTTAAATTEYAYDCNGNLAQVWDPLHPRATFPLTPSQTYAYDAVDRLISVTEPWGGAGGGTVVTQYAYDFQDHLVKVTDGNGTVTQYVYSDRDLLTSQVSEVSGTTTSTYNEHGELVSETDARGLTTTRTVDAADRITLIDYPDASLDTTFTYGTNPALFEKGLLTGITRAGETVLYTYDRFGRLLQDGDLAFGYDANGNRTTITYPGNLVATYTFDWMGDREVSLTLQEGVNPVQVVVKSSPAATYRAFGPLATLAFQNGRSETRLYDRRFAPDRIQVGTGSTLLLDWDFAVNLAGNVTAIDDRLPSNRDRAYGYQDQQYFLTSASGPWAGPLSWAYDRIGNRQTETRGAVTDTYLYLDNAALTGDTAELSQIQLGSGGTRAYTFGPAGHLEALTAGANHLDFTNDDAGQLGEVERPPADEAVMLRYDGRGFLREVRQLVGGSWTGAFTRATYSSDGRVMSLLRKPTPAADEERVTFLYLAGRPVAQWKKAGAAAATLTYLSTDHLGTPVHATDASGAELWEGGFEPFGADFTMPTAESLGLHLRFPGQWQDSLWNNAMLGAGLYYNVHRWYAPGIGSYSQPDPLLSVAPIAAYRYALSNPMHFVDGLGLQALPLPKPPPPIPSIRPVPSLPPVCKPSPWGIIGRGMAAAGAAFTVVLNELFNPTPLGGPGISDFTDPSCKPKCGDCDPVEHGFLQAAVNRSCKGTSSRCIPGMSPQQLETNFKRNTECYYARREVNDRCFRGGDEGHRKAADQAAQAAIRCADLSTQPGR